MKSTTRRAVGIAAVCVLCVTSMAAAHRKRQDNGALCTTHLKQMALATMMYVQDYDEVFPYTSNQVRVQNVISPYVKNNTIFKCPESKTSYKHNALLFDKRVGKQKGYPLAKIKDPVRTVTHYDPSVHADGTWGVAYTDGHVKRHTKLPPLTVK